VLVTIGQLGDPTDAQRNQILGRDKVKDREKQKKDKEISEDDLFKLQDDAQAETDSYIKDIDGITGSKEKEVLEV